ncbi:MAG TPA: hypothetical protein VMS22_02000 [Candidatus Eisenbacteria bacterium]|nr:hypothetical protein [Candidatus Eisenbacteria bacterium]
MHGRITPQFTFIADVNGYYALQPTLTYRINDNVLANVTYSMIAGSWTGSLGSFRQHDMLSLRMTMQFN